MSIAINIDVTDTVTPALAELSRRLQNRTGLHEYIAAKEENVFRTYLRGQASFRHRTAQSLGATPTGELERASQSPEGTATAEGAMISLRPGHLFARAFREVVIKPGPGKKYLPIAVNAEAYGKRPLEFGESLRFMLVGPKKTPILSQEGSGDTRETMYVLVKSVRQKQDRTLLPSDEMVTKEAEEAAKDYLLDVFAEGGVS